MMAKNIRKLRKEKGLTQTELGDKLGFRHSTIAGYDPGMTVYRNQHPRENYVNRKTFLLTMLIYV